MTTDWDELRKKIYKRDNYTCQICGNKNTVVHAHHKIPRSVGGTDDEDNLQTLCGTCHARMHGHEALTFWLLVPCLWKLGIKFGEIDEDGNPQFNASTLEGLRFSLHKQEIRVAGLKATIWLPIKHIDKRGNVIASLPEGFIDELVRTWEKFGIEEIGRP